MNPSTTNAHYTNITQCYEEILDHGAVVLVFPPIRKKFPKTDYLYLLYADLLEKDTSQYIVKSINAIQHILLPFYAIRYRKKIALHYHWLEFQDLKSLLAFPYKLLWFSVFTLFKTPIIWTVHNLEPHDRKWLGFHQWLHRKMAQRAHRLHIHDEALLSDTSHYLNVPLQSKKWCIIPHPNFPAACKERTLSISKLNERYSANIPVNATTILLFGNISAYKGILEFVEWMIGYLNKKNRGFDIHIIIAGPIKKGQSGYHKRIKNAISATPGYFSYLPYFFPEDEYPYLLSASDYCLFNYKRIHTSGGLMMALSYQKKVIAPNMGIFSSQRNHSDVQLFNDEEELYQIMNQLWNRHSKPGYE